MGVHAVEIALSHYLSVPYQKFSEKIIAGKGVLCCMDATEEVKEDIKAIEKIMLITDESLHISIFDIDRWVNPDETADEKVIFKVQDSHKNDKVKKDGRAFSKRNGDDYLLQRKLCIAIDIVNALIMKNIENYSFDFRIKGEMRF